MFLEQTHVKSVTKLKYLNIISCNRSADQRVELSPTTHTVHPIIINAHFLLDNNSQLSSELNVMLVDAVHKYINNTARFNHC